MIFYKKIDVPLAVKDTYMEKLFKMSNFSPTIRGNHKVFLTKNKVISNYCVFTCVNFLKESRHQCHPNTCAS